MCDEEKEESEIRCNMSGETKTKTKPKTKTVRDGITVRQGKLLLRVEDELAFLLEWSDGIIFLDKCSDDIILGVVVASNVRLQRPLAASFT
ncbi:unnamed protein product [Sphenostylis stenocarpa]|uniref:Uncharacterized protein n=1 Tax=Sphenostylis stenocarpa TaxID=92480 RepID=A0AA86VB81_9FABA|nr:unnamed protein product [Sphenostylis stenocarpa]